MYWILWIQKWREYFWNVLIKCTDVNEWEGTLMLVANHSMCVLEFERIIICHVLYEDDCAEASQFKNLHLSQMSTKWIKFKNVLSYVYYQLFSYQRLFCFIQTIIHSFIHNNNQHLFIFYFFYFCDAWLIPLSLIFGLVYVFIYSFNLYSCLIHNFFFSSSRVEFSVGEKPVNSFRMIERHYFGEKLLKSFDFNFGFCIPNSKNTCEHIYEFPKLSSDESK